MYRYELKDYCGYYFLKYLKRLTKPPKKGVSYFLIERISNVNTRLRLAPDYLKKYITEFNYLFSQIYTCSIIDTETIDHDYQYNFGNNMRKFLEAYLFYKYPSIELSLEKRINMFFDGDTIATTQINRVVNEYSHLEEQFDRSLEPIDVESINKIAKLVIQKISTSDPAQFAALVESIKDSIEPLVGKSPPVTSAATEV